MKTFVLLISLFTLQVAISQTEPPLSMNRHEGFGLRLGFNRLHVLDRNTSALLYRGNIPTLNLNYQAAGQRHRWQGELKVGRGSYFSEAYPSRVIQFRNEDVYGKVDSVAVPMRANNSLLALSVGYWRKPASDGSMEYEWGGQLSNQLFYPQGFVQAGLMNVASLSPSLGMAYKASHRQFFSLRIMIPILSLVSRSTYNQSVSQPADKKLVGFFDQGTYWAAPARHREVKLAAAFHFKTGSRWMSGFHYDFHLLKNTQPRELTITQSELGLSMQLIQ